MIWDMPLFVPLLFAAVIVGVVSLFLYWEWSDKGKSNSKRRPCPTCGCPHRHTEPPSVP